MPACRRSGISRRRKRARRTGSRRCATSDRCLELFTHMYGDKPDRWSDDLRGVRAPALHHQLLHAAALLPRATDAGVEVQGQGRRSRRRTSVPWFRVPQRRSRDLRIVCGHWSALGYHDGDGVLSIDTGCVWGGKLCAVRLDQQRRARLRAVQLVGAERRQRVSQAVLAAMASACSSFVRLRQLHQRFHFQLRLSHRQLIRRAVHAVLDDAHRELRQHLASQLVDQLAVAGLQVHRAARSARRASIAPETAPGCQGSSLSPRTRCRQLARALVLVALCERLRRGFDGRADCSRRRAACATGPDWQSAERTRTFARERRARCRMRSSFASRLVQE